MDGVDAARDSGVAAHARSSSPSSQLDHRVVGRRVGPRPAGRRHRAGAQLGDHASPTPPGLALRMFDVQRVERQAGGLQPLVMAADAVTAHRGLVVGARCRLACGWCGWGCGRRSSGLPGRLNAGDGCRRCAQNDHDPSGRQHRHQPRRRPSGHHASPRRWSAIVQTC